jgi:predicted alpha/beta hydrolase family esterase
MSEVTQTTILMVPGLRGDMPDHWQTILEGELPKTACVPRIGTANLSCAAWVQALDDTLAEIPGPVILVAHSAGCLITTHWAQSHSRPIRGALLAAPPDFETPMPAPYPPIDSLRDNGWMPTPSAKLAFPSIVAASSNDPLGSITRAQEMAANWGSRFVDIGPAGHLNPAAGFGPWPRAHDFVRELDALAA